MAKFTLHDVKESMDRCEVHLASAPAKTGGRVRLTWKPRSHSFVLSTVVNGEITASKPGTLETLFAEFEAAAK
jgi:hypothetical protein